MVATRRTVMSVAALVLAGCSTPIALTDQLPEGAALSAGQGMAIGSIVMTSPAGATDPEHKERVDAFRQRKLTATLRRCENGDSTALGTGGGYVGDPYVIVFGVDEEKRFVLRAPVGSYEIDTLVASAPGLFGVENTCKLERVAHFSVHADMTSYVGKLVVATEFLPDSQVKMERAVANAERTLASDGPEHWFDLSMSVVDAKETTLRALVSNASHAPAGIETILMKCQRGRMRFDLNKPPPMPELPPPRKK